MLICTGRKRLWRRTCILTHTFQLNTHKTHNTRRTQVADMYRAQAVVAANRKEGDDDDE